MKPKERESLEIVARRMRLRERIQRLVGDYNSAQQRVADIAKTEAALWRELAGLSPDDRKKSLLKVADTLEAATFYSRDTALVIGLDDGSDRRTLEEASKRARGTN